MAGNPFKKLCKGAEFQISSTAQNTLMDVAQRAYGNAGQSVAAASGLGGGHVVCRVLNNSGAAVGRFGILGLGGIAITPTENLADFQSNPVILGAAPASPTHVGRFAIALEPINAGIVGRCILSGVSVCQVNMAVSGQQWAEVLDSDATQLQSGQTGTAQILYAESGTGTKWAIVRIGTVRVGVLFVLVKSNGGSDGTYDPSTNTGTTASWAYDLYALGDTGYATKLNLSGAVQPTRSAARVTIGPVVKAADGTPGLAYYDASGAIQLWDCKETVATEAC